MIALAFHISTIVVVAVAGVLWKRMPRAMFLQRFPQSEEAFDAALAASRFPRSTQPRNDKRV